MQPSLHGHYFQILAMVELFYGQIYPLQILRGEQEIILVWCRGHVPWDQASDEWKRGNVSVRISQTSIQRGGRCVLLHIQENIKGNSKANRSLAREWGAVTSGVKHMHITDAPPRK